MYRLHTAGSVKGDTYPDSGITKRGEAIVREVRSPGFDSIQENAVWSSPTPGNDALGSRYSNVIEYPPLRSAADLRARQLPSKACSLGAGNGARPRWIQVENFRRSVANILECAT